MGRGSHLCCLCSKLMFFNRSSKSFMPIKQAKKACIRPCDTNNFTQSLTRKYHHTALKVYIVSVMKNKLGTHLSRSVLLIWIRSFSHLPGMQDLWITSVLFFFFHEVSHYKVRKVTDPNFCK